MTDLLDPPRGDADLVPEAEPIEVPLAPPIEDEYLSFAVLPEGDPSQGPAHSAWAANRQLAYRALAEMGVGIIEPVEVDDNQKQEVFRIRRDIGEPVVRSFFNYLEWMNGASFDHLQMVPRGAGALAIGEAEAWASVQQAMTPSGLTEKLHQANRLSNR